jgi:hypothetical protein
MGVLLWLMIPVAFLIAGTIYASIRSRPRRPTAMQDSMASFSKFRRALAASTGNSQPKHLGYTNGSHTNSGHTNGGQTADAADPSKKDAPAPSVAGSE